MGEGSGIQDIAAYSQLTTWPHILYVRVCAHYVLSGKRGGAS